mgnify:FL=1
MKLRLVAMLLAAGASGSACMHGNNSAAVRPIDVPVYLYVTNNNALPVVITISGPGNTFRIGTVHPGMQSKFTIPPTFVGGQSVDLSAANSAGGSYRSGVFQLQPGEIIDMTIAAQMFSSTGELRN